VKINGIRPNDDGAILTGGAWVCGRWKCTELVRFAPDRAK
jgi:hypothetical protein